MASKMQISGTSTGNYVKLDNAILDVWSQEIRFSAQPVLKFASFATVKTDLQATPGQKIKFLRYNPLAGPSPIAETENIETETMSTAYREIGTVEHAKAVSIREFLLRTAMMDVIADYSKALGLHYATAQDVNFRDALLQGGVPDLGSSEQLPLSTVILPFYDSGSGVYAQRANHAAVTATDYFCLAQIRYAVELLATAKVPKIGGDAYICLVHPRQASKIRGESGWISIAQYADPSRIFNGEIGRIEDVRFIETTQIEVIKAAEGSTPNLYSQLWTDGAATYFDRAQTVPRQYTEAASKTSVPASYCGKATNFFPSVPIYQAIILGDGSLAMAAGLPVEMRDNGVEDFGRTRSLGYYSIYGTGVIEETHGIVIESA